MGNFDVVCISNLVINIETFNNYNFISWVKQQQKAKMLKLQRIQVQLANRLFTPQTRKLLRVSVSNIVKTTSQPAKYLNEQSIEWAQPLQFPMLYNKDYMFQIFDVHEFGYNPHEIHMEGKIVIDSINDTKGTWEIYNQDNKRVGYLSADIVSKVPAALKSIIKQNVKSILSPNPQHEAQLQTQKKYKRALRISSIVSRTPTLVLKKACIEIEVAGQKIKTGTLRSRAGELVHIQPRNIMLDESKNYENEIGKIRIYSIKAEGQQEIVAEGNLELDGFKPAKKVILRRDGVEVGEVFIQSKIIDKNQMNNNSSISNSQISAKNAFNTSFQQPKQVLKQRTKSISPQKTIDYTKLQHFGIMNSSRIIKPSLLDTSMVSTRSARKKNSVVNQNNNIAFSKEKRFMLYQDRQNERVTYLNDRSFQYKAEKTGGRYRGASIGYGEKTDFARAKRQLPGVGNYKLPSIWDRY